MASFNKVILIGNLTSDPEVKQTQTGTAVCTFNIAVNRRFAKDGETNADFITIVAWRERAEFVGKYFKKGKPILIVGQLQSRTWADKDGLRRVTWEVIADEISFVSSKNDDAPVNANAYTPDVYKTAKNAVQEEFEPVTDEYLPF